MPPVLDLLRHAHNALSNTANKPLSIIPPTLTLVTNLDFKDWSDYLGDPPLAIALLDRVVDGAIIQRMDGKSYREYRAQQKKARTRQSKTRKPGKS